MFRREWRQQFLVIGLLTFTVALAVFGIAGAANVVSTSNRDFGTANHRLTLATDDAASVDAELTALRAWFGTIEVIAHRDVAVPGSTRRLELRTQAKHGTFSHPMLRLVDGRYPKTIDEFALTGDAAALLKARVGEATTIDGQPGRVVGLVENPSDLSDTFVLTPLNDRADADRYTVLVNTTNERAVEMPASTAIDSIDRRPECHAALVCLSSGQSEQATAGAAALGLATLLLLLVALVAAAGFTVVAQRRLRQLGLLAANGATARHLRLVVMLNGAAVGVVASIAGALIGTALWIAAAPSFENAAGHRIDRLHLPGGLILAAMVLAVLTAIAASRGPARRVARLPVLAALSRRPAKPKGARRSALLACASIGIGAFCLSQAIDISADTVNPLLLIGGIVGLILGIVLLSPSVLAALGRVAQFVPAAARIAMRDLARYRARSGTALAAITLALAIPITAVVVSEAATSSAGEGNLSNRQMLIRIGDDPLLVPERDPAQVRALDTTIASLSAHVGGRTIPLDVAIDPTQATHRGGEKRTAAVVLGRQTGENAIRDLGVLYVATEPVAMLLDIPPSATNGAVDILTPERGDLAFANVRKTVKPRLTKIAAAPYSSMPSALITTESARRHGWTTARAGWLIEAPKPLTSDQLQTARKIAGTSGLAVEERDKQQGLSTIKTAATAIGFLLALGILALTLGLLRSETTNEMHILTANGASKRMRRALSAITSATLAGSGALLALIAAYSGLVAGYFGNLGELADIPTLQLGILLAGLPISAAAASWILAGTTGPTEIHQAPLE